MGAISGSFSQSPHCQPSPAVAHSPHASPAQKSHIFRTSGRRVCGGWQRSVSGRSACGMAWPSARKKHWNLCLLILCLRPSHSVPSHALTRRSWQSCVGPFGVGFLSNRDAEEEGSGKRSNICLVCPSLYFLLHPQMCRCSSWVHIRKPTSSRREYAEALRGDGCASGDSNAPRIVCHAGGSRGANQRGAARCGDRRQGSSVGKYSETAAESTEGARG
jgi:hypothetical protein